MRRVSALALIALLAVVNIAGAKPNSSAALQMLKEGNGRFVSGAANHPHSDKSRVALAGKESQGNYAYATILTCSDSRVPVERIFDAGVMDLFVVRVAGNVTDVDEAGTIEYGVNHVKTSLLVVMGHTQCGAVKAVMAAVEGEGHELERNIPHLVDNIEPAVRRAMDNHPDQHGEEVVSFAIEENVWQSIEDLFMRSPAMREAVDEGRLKVVGAVYDVGAGKVRWLAEKKVASLLSEVEDNSEKAMGAMAEGGHGDGGHGPSAGSSHGSSASATSGASHGESNEHGATAASSSSHSEENPTVGGQSMFDQWWVWMIILTMILGAKALFLKKVQNGDLRVNVGPKIIGGFGVVIALVGVIFFISESKMSDLGDSIAEVAEVYIPLTEKLAAVEKNAVGELAAMNAYLVDGNEQRLRACENLSEETQKELEEADRMVSSHPVLKNLGWEAHFRDIEEQHKEFAAHREALLSKNSGSRRGSSFAEEFRKVEEEGEHIDTEVNDLLTSIEHALDSVSHDAESAEKAGARLIMIIGLGALVIGLAVAWLTARSITRPVLSLVATSEKLNAEFVQFTKVVDAIANNDLTVAVTQSEISLLDVKSKDEIGLLAGAYQQILSAKHAMGESVNKMVANLNDMVRRLSDSSRQVVSAATEIASSAEEMSRGAQAQSQQVTQVAAAMEQMSATIIESSKNAADAKDSAQTASHTANSGGQIVGDTIKGMGTIASVVRESSDSITKLSQSAEQIGEIIGVIDDIADQTNLLALNAAIEAARAGEQGRGFSVVADEVRKLAERTGKATSEITAMIKGIQKDTSQAVTGMESGIAHVERGRELADKAGDSLKEIVGMSQRVMDMIGQMATATEEQSAAAEEISKTMEQITNVTQETATGAAQSAAACELLNRQAEGLQQIVSAFRVK